MQVCQGDLACRGLKERGGPFFKPFIVDLYPRFNWAFFEGDETFLVGKSIIHLSRRGGLGIHEVDLGIQLEISSLHVLEFSLQGHRIGAWGRVSDIFFEFGDEGSELIELQGSGL